MKSICLKVMTLLMAALVLSASGCFNENERSSPEGTVKGHLKAIKHGRQWPRLMYLHPTTRVNYPKYMNVTHLDLALDRAMKKSERLIDISDVKTTLVSKKEGRVMLDDKKWHTRKWATVEVSYKLDGVNRQDTEKLVLLDNKWYIKL